MATTVTQTDNFELSPLPSKPKNVFGAETPNSGSNSDSERVLGTSNVRDEVEQPPGNAVEALQRWNNPRINILRVLATFWSFLVVGMNDGSYGALVPYVSISDGKNGLKAISS